METPRSTDSGPRRTRSEKPVKIPKADTTTVRPPQPSRRAARNPVTQVNNSRQQQALSKARSEAASFDQCCYIKYCSDFSLVQYIQALEEMLGRGAVFQLMKMSGQVLVGLESTEKAEGLSEEGLTIGNTLLKVFPYRKRAEKIVVGNLPIAIRDEDIVTALRPYCRVVSLTHEVVASGGYTWTTGIREALILLNEGLKLVGPVSRSPSSKPMPFNNSALSTPAAELSAPIKQTNSTLSSPAAPSPGANIPVHPQETPTSEPPVPAPSTSQLLPRPEPFLAIIEPTAAPKKETQNKTAPPIQSSTSMQPLQISHETKLIRQTEATRDNTAPRPPSRPRNIIEQIKVSRQMLDQCRSKASAGTFDQMVYLEYSPEFTPMDYIKALENKLGKSCVVQLGKTSGQMLVGLERPEMAETIIEDGLMVKGALLKALPYQKNAEKISISGLPFVIEDADIIRILRPYCQVVSIAPAVNSSGGYTWLDLKKTAFILMNNGKKSQIFLRRLLMGHKRMNCLRIIREANTIQPSSQKSSVKTAPAPNTTAAASPPAALNHPAPVLVPAQTSSTPPTKEAKAPETEPTTKTPETSTQTDLNISRGSKSSHRKSKDRARSFADQKLALYLLSEKLIKGLGFSKSTLYKRLSDIKTWTRSPQELPHCHAVDVAFIQETNVTTLDSVKDLCLGYRAEVVPASGARGSGLACIFSSGVQVIGQRVLSPGKIAAFDVTIRGIKATFINCHLSHAPDERLQQLQAIAAAAVNEDAWVLGDLNISEESASDIASGSVEALGELLDRANLVDAAAIFDAAHLPTSISSCGSRVDKSRLDRVLLPSRLSNRVTRYWSLYYKNSDHCAVLHQIGEAPEPRPPCIARMLRSSSVVGTVETLLNEAFGNIEDMQNAEIWRRWGQIKAHLASAIKSLHDLRNNDDDYISRARKYVRIKLEDVSINSDYPSLPDLGRALRLRCRGTSSTTFYDSAGRVITGPAVRDLAFANLKERFSHPTCSPEDIDGFLRGFTLWITIEESDPLHRYGIGEEEIVTAIGRLPTGKAAGWDDLPCELFRGFEDFFASALLRVFEASQLCGALPSSMRRSEMSLIAKPHGGIGLAGLRPLSLPTTDYRVLSGVLYWRLRPYLRDIVPECQSYAVPGRTPAWNISRVADEVATACREETPLAVVATDLESSFDTLDRGFLMSVLLSVGLPPVFVGRNWENSSVPHAQRSQARMRCQRSVLHHLHRALLLRLEQLLGRDSVLAYADDIDLLIREDGQLEVVKNIFEDFRRASGIRVNFGKSQGLWCGRWSNRTDSPGPPLSAVSLAGRAKAANSLVLSAIYYHLQAYLPSETTIARLQARFARFVWGHDRTSWLPSSILARPISVGGMGLLVVGTHLRLSSLKDVQAALRGGLNAHSWLAESGMWLSPASTPGTWLPSRRRRSLHLFEAAAEILELNHRILQPALLQTLRVVGDCRFLRPPELLAPTRWLGWRIGELTGSPPNITIATRGALADAAALGSFCSRLVTQNVRGRHRVASLADAIVLLGGWLPHVSIPIFISWSSLRRCAFLGHNADVAVRLALHALPHPAHPASARESCIACGSGDLSLAHRYWSCRRIRPVILEAFTIIQRPPDLQSWIFGHDLEDDALAIMASAKTGIYKHFRGLEMRGVQEDPLLVWRRTLSRDQEMAELSDKVEKSKIVSVKSNNETRKHANFASNASISYANWADRVEALENTSNSEGHQKPKGAKRKDRDLEGNPAKVPKADNIPARPSQPPKKVTRDAVVQLKNNRQQQDLSKARSAAASFDQCCYIEYCADFSPVQYIKALEEMLGKGAVFQLMKMSGQVMVGLANVDLADRLVEEGLTIGATFLRAFTYRQRPENIVVGNLPLAIKDEDIIAALRPYCRVVSLAHEVVASDGYTWTIGNREVFILLKDGIKLHQLPANLVIVSKGESTPAYITNGVRCSKCHRQGHRRATCPLGISGERHQDTRQGPVSRFPSSKPIPFNKSALSTPPAELSAPFKQTPSTSSSSAAPASVANFPIRPYETPAPELPDPAPSTSQLPCKYQAGGGHANFCRNWADCPEQEDQLIERQDVIFTKVGGSKKRPHDPDHVKSGAKKDCVQAPGMPLNSSRPQATQIPSKVHECQTTKQKQATFRARSAAGQAYQYVYLEFCPDFTLEQYFRALEAKLGKGTIYQLTKMEGDILAGFSSVKLADKLIEEGLDIEDATLRAFPLRKMAERKVLGNVLFFVEDADLVAALRPYGQVTSIIQKMIQLEDSSWADARREAFIILRDGMKISHIPARLDVKSKEMVTHFYVTYGIKCSLCHKQGNKRANCPRKTCFQEDKLMLPVEVPAARTKGWTKPPSTSNTMPAAAPKPADHRPQEPLPTAAVETAPPPSRASNAQQEDLILKSIPTSSRARCRGLLIQAHALQQLRPLNTSCVIVCPHDADPLPPTPSSPAAPASVANFPVRPYETPAPELPAPAPSTSQLLSRPEPTSTNTETFAAPEEENQDMTNQVENIFIELNADSILTPLYDEVDDDEVVAAVIHRSDREALPDALSYENRKIMYECI
ncbi:hypothetical protein LAZ67_12002136 [Cordylochernes scorpioides]|uniref:Reverse transcriptase domain-containing protein n=1 Tax=Cordylochernes scorpioides TaxID=51811 RepID=A0ABY6L1J9_9ARAC|nr:hypothetical protein LAZ67_12002136 [Cordylochernes scorpioides]